MNLRESGFLSVNMADEFLQKALQKARIFGDKIWSRVVSTEQKCTQVDMADAVLATALSGILGISSLSWCPTNWIVSPSKNNFKLSLYWFSLRYCFFAGLCLEAQPQLYFFPALYFLRKSRAAPYES